jgi:hypothetical protein
MTVDKRIKALAINIESLHASVLELYGVVQQNSLTIRENSEHIRALARIAENARTPPERSGRGERSERLIFRRCRRGGTQGRLCQEPRQGSGRPGKRQTRRPAPFENPSLSLRRNDPQTR